MNQPLLICDLDGTLVDSGPGIEAAIRHSMASAGIESRRPVDESLAGPPLDELLRSVSGLKEGAALDRLRAIFIEAYDDWGCRLTTPYAGVQQMLDSLHSMGVRLALATNKRLAPTVVILQALGWHDRFSTVETVDSRPMSPRSKAEMLCDILNEWRPSAAAYLGDTAADVDAALEASVPCILAGWAHPGKSQGSTAAFVLRPAEVLTTFGELTERISRVGTNRRFDVNR